MHILWGTVTSRRTSWGLYQWPDLPHLSSHPFSLELRCKATHLDKVAKPWPNFFPSWSPEDIPEQGQIRTFYSELSSHSLSPGSGHLSWAVFKTRNQGVVWAPLSSRVWGLLVSTHRRVQKRRMEGGWPSRGRFLLCLTASLLLQGKMGKNRERWECLLGKIQKLSHSPELVECI